MQQENQPTPQLELESHIETQNLKEKFIEQQKQQMKEEKEAPLLIGPGTYNPSFKVAKKTTPCYNWGVSKSMRSQTVYQAQRQNPGPGAYVSQGMGDREERSQYAQYKLLQNKINFERYNDKFNKHIEYK